MPDGTQVAENEADYMSDLTITDKGVVPTPPANDPSTAGNVPTIANYNNENAVFDPSDPNYHHYELQSFICGINDPGYTVLNVYNQLLANAAPGQDQPATTDHTMAVFIDNGLIPLGMIRQEVDPENLTVINSTVPQEHLLDPGQVTRTVISTGSNIWIKTTGVGVGPLGTLNSILAPSTFHNLRAAS